jgi:DEAD/DEAH box helicase domain-containing protein
LVIQSCECEEGCPACIYSAKCGSGNVPLDKQAAVMVLAMLLDKPEAKEWIRLGAAAVGPDEEDIIEEDGEEPEEEASPRVMVLDIETRRGAEEVGGWGNAHLMGVAVAVVWDSKTGGLTSYFEDRIEEMFKHLRGADLVVGFNVIGFDYKVLSSYDDGTLARLPTFDILRDIRKRLGFRLSLAHLAEHTLAAQKSADGLQSLEWIKQGRLDLVEEYCKKDVEITRDLFYHGLEKSFVRFKDRQGKLMELALDWELDELVEKADK